MLARGAIFAVGLLAAGPTAAGYVDTYELASIGSIRVELIDTLNNECVPRSKALGAEAELILRRSGVGVSEDRSLPMLLINISGGALRADYCVVNLEVGAFRKWHREGGASSLVLIYLEATLLWGEIGSMQTRLRESVSEMITALANEILKARQRAD